MMNKKRLAALALSAVMAASTMSFPVYAADFSDGATTTEAAPAASAFTSDVEVQTAEPVEETLDAVGENNLPTEPGTVMEVEENSIKFYYNDGNKGTIAEYKYVGKDEIYKVPAVVDTTMTTPATCVEPEHVWLKATIDGREYKSTNWFVGKAALGESAHQWHEWTELVAGSKDSHNVHARIRTYKECSICKTKIELTKDQENGDPVLSPHTLSDKISYANTENVKLDENGDVIFKANGNAVLEDETKSGRYDIVRYCTSKECADERERLGWEPTPYYELVKHVEVAPVKGKYAKVIAYDTEHIKTNMNGMTFYNPTQELPLTNFDDIELYDCTEGGWYIVEYFSTEGTENTEDDRALSQEEKYYVPKHHFNVYTTAEFKSESNANQCYVDYSTSGEMIVTNNSCYQPIDYYEVAHCQAAGCNEKKHVLGSTDSVERGNIPFNHDNHTMISKVEKTAEPAGEHAIKVGVYNEIERYKKNSVFSKLLTCAWLNEIIEKGNGYVELSNIPDCETGGTVTVNYYCINEKENRNLVRTQEVKVVPTEHTRSAAEREEGSYVAPTCDKNGSYVAVVKCAFCGKVLERDEKAIARLPHTNEDKDAYKDNGSYIDVTDEDTAAYLKFTGDKVVDRDGELLAKKGQTLKDREFGEYGINENKSEFLTSVGVYTNCTECGKHKIALDGAHQNEISVTVVDVKKQPERGTGSITLKASYKLQDGENAGKTITETVTVPYFSSIEAYQARTDVPETPEEKLNGLHWDEDGECRYYVDGEFQKDFSGILEYEGKSFVLKNGVLCRTASGLTPIDDEWYYLTEGRIRTDVTQLVEYDGEWFFVTEGKLDTSVNDLVEYDGETFVFVDGRLAQEGNGLWVGKDDVWYFLSNGRVAEEHTGLAMYDNEWFYVVEGKIAVDYNGTVDFEGGTFKVVGGMVKEQVK